VFWQLSKQDGICKYPRLLIQKLYGWRYLKEIFPAGYGCKCLLICETHGSDKKWWAGGALSSLSSQQFEMTHFVVQMFVPGPPAAFLLTPATNPTLCCGVVSVPGCTALPGRGDTSAAAATGMSPSQLHGQQGDEAKDVQCLKTVVELQKQEELLIDGHCSCRT